MKTKLLVAGAFVLGLAASPIAAWSQLGMDPSGMVPIGRSTLNPGQYLLSNLQSGQSLFLVIDGNGRMLAQDPRGVTLSMQPLQQPNLQQQLLPGQQQQILPGQQQPNSKWGGLLKQGLDAFLTKPGDTAP